MSKKIITCAVTLAMLFSVFSYPSVGYGAAEQEAKVAVPQVAKVTGVKTKRLGSSAIQVKWQKAAGASGYEVYRYNRKTRNYKKIQTTRGTICKSTNLKADTAYRYKVKAYASKNGKNYYGVFSNSVQGKTDKSDSQKIIYKAKKKIGAKYKAGAAGPNAFDCTGFVYWVYKNAGIGTKKAKKAVVRTSSAGMYLALKKYKIGTSIRSVKKAKPGDIILFKKGGRYSHAAIYSGRGKIIHASNPRKGVVVQSLKQLHRSGTRVAAIIHVVE